MKAARKSARTKPKNPDLLSGDSITPILPPEDKPLIENKAFELTCKASAFAGQVHPDNQLMLSDLVRSINCNCSNLIERHHTHPRAIDSALTGDYALHPEKRNLPLEAAAHLHLQVFADICHRSFQSFPTRIRVSFVMAVLLLVLTYHLRQLS